MSLDLVTTESKLSDIANKSDLTGDDIIRIGYLLASILTEYFSSLDRDTGMKGWSVDDMYPNKVHSSKNKLTVVGNINWLHGGETSNYYQADIATDTSPILYSIKLKNNHEKQQLYIGKTYTGWVLNVT